MKITKIIFLFALSFFTLSSFALAVEIGDRPTYESINEEGEFDIMSHDVVVSNSEFQSGTIYYPDPKYTLPAEKYGVIAILPGALGEQIDVIWLAKRLTSYGFVTIAMNATRNTFSQVTREKELLDALTYATTIDNTVKNIIDPTRKAAAGYSKGGGEALIACSKDPSLKAGIGLTPWYAANVDPSSISIPQLIIGAQDESLFAPLDEHATRIYNNLPLTTKKAYAVLKKADHLTPISLDERISRLAVAWAKYFVDGDTRYLRFLCGDDAVEYQTNPYKDTDLPFSSYNDNCAKRYYDGCACKYE